MKARSMTPEQQTILEATVTVPLTAPGFAKVAIL
jgi:hypothetical protein